MITAKLYISVGIVALLLFIGFASAKHLVVPPPQNTSIIFQHDVKETHPSITEDSAVIGYTVVYEGVKQARGVGVVGRAFSKSYDPNNIMWGLVAETMNYPSAAGSLVGIETAVVNRAHDNQGEVRGLDVVFKNRMDSDINHHVVLGQNRYNENSAGIVFSSQPRSPAGEFAGWQTGIRFAANSLDRSSSKPYVTAIDLTELDVKVPLYLIVWRCGQVKCGLRPTDDGATIVYDIEGKQTATNPIKRR